MTAGGRKPPGGGTAGGRGGRPGPGSGASRSGSAAALTARPARIPAGLGGRPERRLTLRHFLGLAVLAFGLGYAVCRIADWAVTSDEERIVAQLESLAGRARNGELERLLDDVRLADFGFSAGGWGELYSYGAGQEDQLLAKAREWSAWGSVRTLRIKLDEDDVRVDGDQARASADLLFEEDGRPWRQPARFLFRRQGDRWYVTALELVRPDEILRP
jgi:hypothetical protein